MKAIFNSLGSNYSLAFVLQALFGNGTEKDSRQLIELLEKRYEGKAQLFYKGREALTYALQLLHLPDTAKVAINGFTCAAVFNAVRTAGLEPVCLDLEKDSYLNFSAKILEKAVQKDKHIKVVIVQNTLGYPCDIEEIQKICKKHNLILIEDLAHCVGTKYTNGKEAGTVGDFTILSFSQDKIIDAITGGAVVVRNTRYQMEDERCKRIDAGKRFKDRIYPAITYKIRFLYGLGIGKFYHFIVRRLNLLSNIMDESLYSYYALPYLQAKLAYIQYQNLEAQLDHRKKITKIYADNLPKEIVVSSQLKTYILSSNLRFSLLIEKRKQCISFLKDHGVFVGDIWYFDVAPECPNAVEVSHRIVNLPTHMNVSEKDAKEICRLINLWWTQNS